MPTPETEPMSILVAASIPDDSRAVQLTVAWAGEGICAPPRLGWWRTDLVAVEGGGDLLERLLPRTHAWASLESVLKAEAKYPGPGEKGLAVTLA
ncbi:BREX-6 system BrxE protein [Sorangium sp. KYC3313]|uniref:BREX-6 system BrxE protein n=1 Tax=Sorangium sp. KYC3313 TaxID=3449740 RepID=UPI003F8981A6